MQVPSMGCQESKAEDQSSRPKQQQKRYQQFWKQHQKQPGCLYGCSLFQRAKWEPKERMQ